MDSVATDTVKHRKARAAREGFDARAMSPAKALRVGLGKAADGTLGLALSVSTVEQSRLSQKDLPEVLAGTGLTCLVEDDRGRRGAVRLDFPALSAVIEIQTIGRVAEREVVERPLTRTDAALCAPLLDAVFEAFETGAEDLPDGQSWQGYRFGAMAEDAHSLSLVLEADHYHLFRVGVMLGEAKRAGVYELLLPVMDAPQVSKEKPGRPRDESRALSPVVMGAPVTLQAILARHSIPLEKALSLKAGDQLIVPGSGAMALRLEAPGGHLVSDGRLGQVNGMRAIRLRKQPSHQAAEADQKNQAAAKPASVTRARARPAAPQNDPVPKPREAQKTVGSAD